MIEELLRHKTDSAAVQFFRYLFVGGLAFLVDFGCLFGLTRYAGLHYLSSAAVGFVAGLTTNYALSIAWVFHRRTFRNKVVEFAIFALLGVLGLGLNQVLLWFFTERVGFHYLFSKVVTTGMVLLWNFGSRKLLLFQRGSGGENASRSSPELFDKLGILAEPEPLAGEACSPGFPGEARSPGFPEETCSPGFPEEACSPVFPGEARPRVREPST